LFSSPSPSPFSTSTCPFYYSSLVYYGVSFATYIAISTKDYDENEGFYS